MDRKTIQDILSQPFCWTNVNSTYLKARVKKSGTIKWNFLCILHLKQKTNYL